MLAFFEQYRADGWEMTPAGLADSFTDKQLAELLIYFLTNGKKQFAVVFDAEFTDIRTGGAADVAADGREAGDGGKIHRRGRAVRSGQNLERVAARAGRGVYE